MLSACSQSEQGNKTSDTNTKKVAITAIVEHPALDAVRQGVIDELRAEGYEQGKNLQLDFQSAQGNTATAGQIAKKFAGNNPDVIITIGTPSAQSMVAATRKIPIVFAAVTDPVAAKLVTSWEPSKTNVTGVSDELPLQPQIDLMKQVVPNLKTVGYVYSPGKSIQLLCSDNYSLYWLRTVLLWPQHRHSVQLMFPWLLKACRVRQI